MAKFNIIQMEGLAYVECQFNGRIEMALVDGNVTRAKMEAYSKCLS